MRGYKEPGFQERTAAAMQAKNKALDKLRAKPPMDEAELAKRTAARLAKEAAQAEKREAARLVREEAKAAKLAQAQEAAAAKLANKKPELTDAERKAARDARYAARKNKKKR